MEGLTQPKDNTTKDIIMSTEGPQPDPMNQIKDKTLEKELPLTEQEAAMDMTKMYELDLGD